MKTVCFACQKPVELTEPISRREDCPHCRASMHVCRMCRFYSRSAYNECSEPAAERVLEKEKANFCDYFSIGDPSSTGPKKNDVLSAAEALFKKS